MPRSISTAGTGVGGSDFPNGTVDTYALLPDYSTRLGEIWFVKGPAIFALNTKGFYIAEPTGWAKTSIKVQIAEDAGSFINWTDWNAFISFSNGVNLGDQVRYNNVTYTNLTGTYTSTTPDSDLTNWETTKPQGIIIVAKKGGDFATIKEACDSITDSTLNNPYYIQALSGDFIEEPFKIPDYTTLVLSGTKVCPSDTVLPFIELGTSSVIREGSIICNLNLGATIWTQSAGTVADTVRLSGVVTPNGVGFLATNGGQLTVLGTSCGYADTAYWANAGIIVFGTISATICNIGLRVSNGGYMTGAIFGSFGGVLVDVQQDDAISSMRALDLLVSVDRIQSVDRSLLKLTLVSDKEDDEAFVVLQELSVGTPEQGYETQIGEGDSYTRGMLVYTKTPTNVFTDVSTEARSASGSTFEMPGTAIDNALYIASSLSNMTDVLEHYGIKTKVATACVPGTGSIILEYWNGTAWVSEHGMEVESQGSYYPNAENYFQKISSHHIRYNLNLAADSWTKSDPMALGTDYYWVRFIVVSAITTAPIFEQFKLHTNRWEANADGWNEFFGKARPIGQLPFVAGGDRAFSGNLANVNLWLSNNLGAGLVENSFTSTSDRIGRFFFAPQDMDTSTPIELIIAGRASGTGSVTMTISWGKITTGETIYNSNPAGVPTINTISDTKATIAGQLTMFHFKLDVSDIIARRLNGDPDVLVISINSSALTGTVFAYCALEANYVKWCNGGHI